MQRRAHSRFLIRLGLGAIVALAPLLLVPKAHADPAGGTVTGAVELPPRAARKKLPIRGTAFTDRIKGPLKEPRAFDPRPKMIVVLIGGPVAKQDAKPPNLEAIYRIIGESFATDVFPYVAGGKVKIKNDSKSARRLYAVGDEGAIDSAPVGKNGAPIEAPSEPYKSLEVRDRDSAHLSGTLVAMPHTYFAVPKRNGAYSIAGVPAGKWKVSIWYDGALVKLASSPSVTVISGKPAKAAALKLPANLTSKAGK